MRGPAHNDETTGRSLGHLALVEARASGQRPRRAFHVAPHLALTFCGFTPGRAAGDTHINYFRLDPAARRGQVSMLSSLPG
jgi:hypothetical protein